MQTIARKVSKEPATIPGNRPTRMAIGGNSFAGAMELVLTVDWPDCEDADVVLGCGCADESVTSAPVVAADGDGLVLFCATQVPVEQEYPGGQHELVSLPHVAKEDGMFLRWIGDVGKSVAL